VADSGEDRLIPKGPAAEGGDHVFRVVHPTHWEDGQLTSLPFKINRPFSVFLQSKLGDSVDTAGAACVDLLAAGKLGGLDQDSGVVGFGCEAAADLGFSTHLEREPHEHPSHAHVYAVDETGQPMSNSRLKKKARDLRKLAKNHIVRGPQPKQGRT
jgi:hypothetical protein